MTAQAIEAIKAEKTDLERRLHAREGQAGYRLNTIMIKARLAWIEDKLANNE